MNAERDQQRAKNFARLLFSFGRIVLGVADDELRRGHELRNYFTLESVTNLPPFLLLLILLLLILA